MVAVCNLLVTNCETICLILTNNEHLASFSAPTWSDIQDNCRAIGAICSCSVRDSCVYTPQSLFVTNENHFNLEGSYRRGERNLDNRNRVAFGKSDNPHFLCPTSKRQLFSTYSVIEI